VLGGGCISGMQIWKSLCGTDHLSDKRFHLVAPQRENSIHGQIDEHHVDSGLSAPRLRTQRCATVKGQASVCTHCAMMQSVQTCVHKVHCRTCSLKIVRQHACIPQRATAHVINQQTRHEHTHLAEVFY
jgi:hypothetical protein